MGLSATIEPTTIGAMKATERHIKTIEDLNDDEQSSLLGLFRKSRLYGLAWKNKTYEECDKLES